MDHSYYRWVVVASGGLLGCVAIGTMFLLPVLLSPMASATGWSRTGISSAMTIGFLAMAGSLGMATGPIVGGWIYDTRYQWLYLGRGASGLGRS